MFIMRIWAEELGDGKQEWRGKVQHSPSGNIQYFRDLPALTTLVEAMLAQAAVPVVAPQGRRPWLVAGKLKDEMVAERAKVEGGIGAVKSGRYGFNRPAAHSAEMMGVCGQRAVLGFNLNKLVRELAKRQEKVLVG